MDKYIQRLTEALEKGIENATIKTAELLEKENKKLAPKDTGYLKNSIYTNIKKPDYMAEVRARASYADEVIHGTGIYNTEGVRDRDGWIYNATNDGWYFTMGQKPNNFPHQAYENKKNEISKVIDKEIDNAISKL